MNRVFVALISLLLLALACKPQESQLPPAPVPPVIGMTPEPPIGPDDGLTLVFHGSFSSEGLETRWWHPTGGFYQHLNDEVGNVWRIVDRGRVIQLYPTPWPSIRPTGGNLERAGQILLNTLRAIAANNPPKTDIIAHSHGGNVLLYALAALAEEQAANPDGPQLKVGRLVFLATPQIVRSEQLRHWPHDIEHPFYSMYDQVINLYSEEDQIGGALAGLATRGSSEWSLERFEIPRAINIEIKTDVGMADAHQVLHSNRMATLLGRALEGEIPWEESSFPELTDDDDQGNEP